MQSRNNPIWAPSSSMNFYFYPISPRIRYSVRFLDPDLLSHFPVSDSHDDYDHSSCLSVQKRINSHIFLVFKCSSLFFLALNHFSLPFPFVLCSPLSDSESYMEGHGLRYY